MPKNIIFFIFLLFIPTLSSAENIKFYDLDLKREFDNIDYAMEKKREKLRLSKANSISSKSVISELSIDEKIISNCEAYFDAVDEGFSPIYIEDKKQKAGYYYPCVAIDMIDSADSFEEDHFKGNIHNLIFENLNLKNLYTPTILKDKIKLRYFKNIAGKKPHLYKYSFHSNKIEINYIGDDKWYFAFHILAKADFNGDGKADVLMQFINEAKDPNKKFYHDNFYILSREDITSDIIATKIDS